MDFWQDVKFEVTDTPSPAPAGGGSLGVAPSTPPTPTTVPGSGAAASNVAASPSPAGSFRMSRDEMDALRQKFEGTLQKIREQRVGAQRLTTMHSPADEPVSNGVTATLNNAGEYYMGHLRRQEAYLLVVIDKMRQALGMVSMADEDNQKIVQNAGGGSVE